MPETIAAPEQAQAASEPQAVEQSTPSLSEASEQLTLARITQAAPEEIARLEALVNPPKAEPPQTTTEPAPVEQVAAEAEANPNAATEAPAGEEPQTAEEVTGFDRIRLGAYSKEEKALINSAHLLVQSGKCESFESAWHRVNGTTPPAKAEVIEEIQAPALDVAAIQKHMADAKTRLQEIAARRAEIRTEPAPDVFNDELATLLMEQGDLHDALIESRGFLADARLEQTQESFEQSVLAEAKQRVLHEVAKQWPEVVVEGSEMFDEAASIAEDAKANPRHALHKFVRSPDFVTHCAELAAKRLGKTALSPNAAAAKAPSASAKSPAPPQPGPASGSRASAPAAPAKSQQQVLEESEAALMAVLTGQSQSFPTGPKPGGIVVVR